MLYEDQLRQLSYDRRREREDDARLERLATQARRRRSYEPEGRARAALFGQLIMAHRRHATS